MMELSDRKNLFLAKVVKTAGCWNWTAAQDKDGYGIFRCPELKRHASRAHVAAWFFWRGRPTPGLCVLHKCDNPRCVRPSHLELGTIATNNKQMLDRGRRIGLRYNVGEKHPRAILDRVKVQLIRDLSSGGFSQRKIAKQLALKRSTIQYVLSAGSWQDV